MTENEFLLSDRISKIRAINEQYDLENNAYLSFSGGKDSTVLHYLLDEALPNNKIPRVFLNTGIEYKLITKFVKEMAEKDDRIIIYTVGKNIKETLERVGYPFKSKEHSLKVHAWKRGWRGNSVSKYFRQIPNGYILCPKDLMYQMSDDFQLNISDQCCIEFKKKPAHQYQKESKRNITLTGMTKTENGQRTNLQCTVFEKDSGKLKKFHPLAIVGKEFEDWYIVSRSIKLCQLYYPPYNFDRTGCLMCPFSLDLQAQFDTLSKVAPEEIKRAEWLWKPVYDEYRRIGYRLKQDNQPTLFD